MNNVALACLILCALPAKAAEPLGPADFSAHVMGQIFEFSIEGQIIGSEDYFSNRCVLWRYLDGACHYGVWYPIDGKICFEYEDLPGTQCWAFFLEDGDLTALFASDPMENGVYVARPSQVPLDCPGPLIGS